MPEDREVLRTAGREASATFLSPLKINAGFLRLRLSCRAFFIGAGHAKQYAAPQVPPTAQVCAG
jgi:hypothetical protein